MLFEEFVGERYVASHFQRRFRQFLVQREEGCAARSLTGQEFELYWAEFFCTLSKEERHEVVGDFNDGVARMYQGQLQTENPEARFLAFRGVIFIRWSVLPYGQAVISWN